MGEEAAVVQTTDLTPGAQRLVEAMRGQEAQTPPGVFDWLVLLLQRHSAMLESLSSQVQGAALAANLRQRIAQGDRGEPLPVEAMLQRASERASTQGRNRVGERDLAAITLQSAGYTITAEDTAAMNTTSPAPDSAKSADAAPIGSSSGSQTGSQKAVNMPTGQTYQWRAKRPTPALDQFGRDLTRLAVEGKLKPMIGREDELQLVIETLYRETKRNPVLIGPAGVGKTAIVEGLAQRVVNGQVPAALRNLRIVEIQPSVLVAGTGIVGELNERMKGIIADASQDGIVLFIDEVHSMVGAGGGVGSGDMASMLKPSLARGDFACIAATTDDEYRRFIEPDAALERRFQPIRVQELIKDQTVQVLHALRDQLAAHRGIRVDDDVLQWLADFAEEFLRNRYFPDKAVDLLEQAVAHALTEDQQTVTLDDAQTVAQRMIGMPLDLDARLATLREQLAQRPLLTAADATALLNRLSYTMRGLDIRAHRPNVVALLAGRVAAQGGELGRIIARSLLGSPDRVISIDFSRFTSPADVSALVGAPPGYVGYDNATPLHELAQMPWCVLHCENVDSAHPAVVTLLAQGLDDGYITDSRGRRLYLSDAIVLLSVASGEHSQAVIGFRLTESGEKPRTTAFDDLLGRELMDQVDLVFTRSPEDANQRTWLERWLLPELAKRYRRQGIDLECDTSVVDWLVNQHASSTATQDWERALDEQLGPVLVPYLPHDHGQLVALTLRYQDGTIHVIQRDQGKEQADGVSV